MELTQMAETMRLSTPNQTDLRRRGWLRRRAALHTRSPHSVVVWRLYKAHGELPGYPAAEAWRLHRALEKVTPLSLASVLRLTSAPTG